MPSVLALYRRLAGWPAGRWLFSRLVCLKAPYFSSIAPRIVVLEPGRGIATLRHRRAVTNHIGTVHAIALCNGLEGAMGALAEASVPADKRWIPKGMEVAYTAKAAGDVTCIAETDPEQWAGEGDLPVRVRGELADGTVVVEGVIRLWVTPRR